MGGRKRKTRRRRRQKFLALHTVQEGDKDISPLINEALKQTEGREQLARQDEEEELSSKAAATDAEALTDLYLKDVSRTTKPVDIVEAILMKLYIWRQVPLHELNVHLQSGGESANTAVLRCEMRENKHNLFASAYVTVSTAEQARTILDMSPIRIKDDHVKVFKSRRVSVPGMAAGSRATLDRGNRMWKIGSVHLGEKVAESTFCAFWSSSPFFDLAQESHVEINPVQGILAVTVKRPQCFMMRAIPPRRNEQNPCTESADFATTNSMLRIEIPFRSVCGKICAERNQRSSDGYAVYFPISKAPYLFRSEVIPYQRKNIWDCRKGAVQQDRWLRTIDPTRNSAFSRARAVRICLELNELNSFFQDLQQLYLATVSRPDILSTKSLTEASSPKRSQIFGTAKHRYRLSFDVRYMTDCIVSLGTLSLSAIKSTFWDILAYEIQHEPARLRVLEHMMYTLSSNERFSMLNDPVEILRNCMSAVNTAEEADDGDEDDMSDSDESVRTEDTEEFQIEQFFRQLTLEEEYDPGPGRDFDPMMIDAQTGTRTRRRLPSRQHTYIRRVVVTPTRTIAHCAEPDLLNRVLREFWDHEERFIRVSFCDEDGGSIAHAGSEDLYARVRAALRDGIEVAGERFVFLAFSNSQLRDHAVWMYNETEDDPPAPPTADAIRAWMGVFNRIRVPGKFAARQGQTFSSTVGTTTLEKPHEALLPDVYDGDGKYNFSDGIGVMSYELAKFVSTKLRLDSRSQVPSAFQIRYGGAKGMLTVWDNALPRGQGGKVEVAIRESMRKFECSHRTLEVVGFAKRLPLFLNRQIIMLLSAAGVPDHPFEELQDRVLCQLDRAMRSDGAQDALRFLFSSGHCQMEAKLRSSAPMSNPADFFRAGLTCDSCEHLHNVMYAFRKKVIKDLTQKARIPIDYEKGLCAIGVLDEIGTLRPDEIFCQFTEPATGKTRIAKGRVTIGRSPCLHPGDIQQVWAVDRPSLHHLVDVIVFPRTGFRPIPSMLSGGDLDGDIFFCIFDPRIAPPPSWRCAPMESSVPKPVELPRSVQTSDIADFFVQYIRNDRLGQIANAHLVHADKEAKGVHSEKCLRLATLHSIAVDFAKTGVPAPYPRDLQPKNERQQYPDFMGKHQSVSYMSKRIVGKLYRSCVASQRGTDKLEFVPSQRSRRIDEIIDRFPVDENLQADAWALCNAYNADLLKLMHQFGVHSEGEVVSGQVLRFSTRHSQLQGKREHFNLAMRLNRETNELRAQYREAFFRGLGQQAKGEYNVYTIIKACAWYRACRKQAHMDRMFKKPVLVSFPWVVSDVLLPVISNGLQKPG